MHIHLLMFSIPLSFFHFFSSSLIPNYSRLQHALSDDDPDRRWEFAGDSSFSDRIFWTDEATSKLNGHVNRHNYVYYTVKNSQIVITQEVNASGVAR